MRTDDAIAYRDAATQISPFRYPWADALGMLLLSIAAVVPAATGFLFFFFFQAEDGIRDLTVTGVQTCALPISCSDNCVQYARASSNKLERDVLLVGGSASVLDTIVGARSRAVPVSSCLNR